MILMALDHVRDYVTILRFQPENLAQGSTALFMTRWVTHFCAPAFFLLAGLGIGIAMNRGKSAAEMSRYLVIRGLWLVVLELTITAVAWQFGFKLVPMFGIVIWALGWSMVIMAPLVHIPKVAVGAIALILIFGHNLFDGVQPESLGAFAPLWHVLHVPGFAVPGKMLIAYPLIPWAAVMALGFAIAAFYGWKESGRRRMLINLGLAATVAFVALRAVNGYGNPAPWSVQRTMGLTVSSFLNVLKYPPSLQFLLMTLGPTLVVLALLERGRGRIAEWLAVYGRVPLFYYVVHIFLIHVMAMVLAFIQGGEWRRIPVIHDPASIPDWYGVSLPGVYVAWAIAVALMYFPCRWYARVKESRPGSLFQYL